MNRSAVFHRTSDNYCYALDEQCLAVQLTTGQDIRAVTIVYGDPFDGGILGGNWSWTGAEAAMTYTYELENHRWWSIELYPEHKRCKYYFILEDNNGERLCYYEDGFYTEDEVKTLSRKWSYFIFPWMNQGDVNQVPSWVQETVWYQIFPERFCNGDQSNDPEGTKPWGYHPVTNEEFYGGDLQGIINKLDYLKELGITGLYLTPVFLAETAHKYDTEDYLQIDPHFGDDQVMKHLVDEAHKRGIKVMLDGVFNHSGRHFAPWVDVCEKGPDSLYYHWFMVNDWPFEGLKHTRGGEFFSFAYTPNMPKLNTNHPEVIDYLLDVVTKWVKDYGIDALRLDVANEFSHQFSKALHRLTKTLNPEFYILGEIWHDAMPWLRGDEFDGVMNYPLTTAINDFWIDKHQTSRQFAMKLNRNFTMYMKQTNDVLFNLLDSHDTNRLMDKTGDVAVFYQQLMLLFLMPGSPCIYYGTEIAMEGSYDPDCRRCMPWEAIEEGLYNNRIETMKQIIRLRHDHRSMGSQSIQFIHHEDNPRLIHLIKGEADSNKIEAYINGGDQEIQMESDKNVIFSQHLSGNILGPKGILLRKVPTM